MKPKALAMLTNRSFLHFVNVDWFFFSFFRLTFWEDVKIEPVFTIHFYHNFFYNSTILSNTLKKDSEMKKKMTNWMDCHPIASSLMYVKVFLNWPIMPTNPSRKSSNVIYPMQNAFGRAVVLRIWLASRQPCWKQNEVEMSLSFRRWWMDQNWKKWVVIPQYNFIFPPSNNSFFRRTTEPTQNRCLLWDGLTYIRWEHQYNCHNWWWLASCLLYFQMEHACWRRGSQSCLWDWYHSL